MTTHSLPGALSPVPLRRDARPVLVGVDSTADSALAVSWAAAEAGKRGVPLQIVRGYTWAYAEGWMTADDRYIIADLRAEAEKIARAALEQVRVQDPDLPVTVTVTEKYPPDLIAQLSMDASLVVVGNSHRGLFSRALLGSVANAVTARSAAPVVVVCGPPPLTGEGEVVVAGVRADETAEPVLAFAFEHALRHGLGVRAVLCWRATGLADARPIPRRAELWLAETVAGWRSEYPDVPVTTVAERGEAAPTLVEEAVNSTLLVVGRHGHTRRLGAVLGSVSQAVIHHATRPVAIVPVAPLEER